MSFLFILASKLYFLIEVHSKVKVSCGVDKASNTFKSNRRGTTISFLADARDERISVRGTWKLRANWKTFQK